MSLPRPSSLDNVVETISTIVSQLERARWRRIGDAGEPAFQGAWANLDANRPARFYKDALGIVRLDGIISAGAVPSIAFTLPGGCRPSHRASNAHFVCAAAGAYGEIAVNVNGDVLIVAMPGVWISLASISFRAL